jgi:hypothetical protein
LNSEVQGLKGHWFAEKEYGYGLVPVAWQGWLVVVAYGAVLLMFFFFMHGRGMQLASVVAATVILLIVTRAKSGPA